MKKTIKWLLPAICLCGSVAAGAQTPESLSGLCAQSDTSVGGSVPPDRGEVTDGEGNRYRLVPIRKKNVTDAEGNRYQFLDPDGREVIDEGGLHYRLALVKRALGPRHSFGIEIGAVVEGVSRTAESGDIDNWLMPGEYPGERRYYQGPLRTSGAIGITYGYQVKRWLAIGATLTYAGFWRDIHFSADDRIFANQREHFVLVMPYARFTWLNRPVVRLYSGVHLGYRWSRERYFFSDYTNHNSFAGHLTLIGVSVGRRLFGYAELGVGVRGVALAGIGYRFGKTLDK